MKKCPFCAEQIQDEAIICRFCSRDIPAVSRKAVTLGGIVIEEGVAAPEPPPAARAMDHDSYHAMTMLSIFIPFVGLIVGIVYGCRSQPVERRLGEHMIAVSIATMIVGGALLTLLSFL